MTISSNLIRPVYSQATAITPVDMPFAGYALHHRRLRLQFYSFSKCQIRNFPTKHPWMIANKNLCVHASAVFYFLYYPRHYASILREELQCKGQILYPLLREPRAKHPMDREYARES